MLIIVRMERRRTSTSSGIDGFMGLSAFTEVSRGQLPAEPVGSEECSQLTRCAFGV